MTKNIEISNADILDAIRKYHFGAMIEIKNGMPTLQRRQGAKRQVIRGRKILQKAVGDDNRVVGGLATIKPEKKRGSINIPTIKELDFRIEITDYNPTLLTAVVESSLRNGSDLLNKKDKKFLDLLLGMAEHRQDLSLRTLLNPTGYTFSRLSHHMRSTYVEDVAKIKGAVLELYVQRLFSRAMPNDKYMSATEVRMRDKTFAADRDTCTDIIIAASRKDFLTALDTLVSKYHAKTQRITVDYPNPTWKL
ncbi:hypothetical protein ACFL96_13935 [Thermoproteota archaeon]